MPRVSKIIVPQNCGFSMVFRSFRRFLGVLLGGQKRRLVFEGLGRCPYLKVESHPESQESSFPGFQV